MQAMTEAELRKQIGNAKVDEIKELVRKAKAEGKNPDEIEAILRKFLKEYTETIFNVIGNLIAFVPPVKS